MYFRAIPALVKHPSILAVPLLAGVVDVLLSAIAPTFTGPLGGGGGGLFTLLIQLVYLWAFGVAIIQASNIWRGRKGSFDEAWEEGRRKFGGIAVAAVGFQFVVWVASYVGSLIPVPLGIVGLVLGAVAAFFLIYTIPAAAIGGLPGQMALSASIDAVRGNVVASIILAFVFVVLWYVVVQYALLFVVGSLPALGGELVLAGVRALILGYLAFPFAKQYDDVAFRRFW
jgi:hypothetical protein